METETTSLLVILATTLAVFFFLMKSAKEKIVTTVLTKDRRSVEKYSGPAPRDALMKALNCAVHAPNHWKTESWRFRMLGPAGKTKLADLQEKFQPGGPFGAPDYLVVSIKAGEHAKSPKDFSEWTTQALEDHAACSCAIQNFMISCASQGIATKWMTGKMGVSGADMLTECCNVSDVTTEHYMGTILVGQSQVPMNTMKVPERKSGTTEPIFQETA
mmetsp:Transcript_42375/g.48134  ORF Transcript_42375/g.48134 Transcript_42375/m.48134 type:complete len:217 (-) Transcript_42375:62-712(-)